jgi:hypothetical protein
MDATNFNIHKLWPMLAFNWKTVSSPGLQKQRDREEFGQSSLKPLRGLGIFNTKKKVLAI